MAMDPATIIALVTALMPLIDQAIKWIEKLFPKEAGASKKAMAVEVIKGISPEAGAKTVEGSNIIGSMIDQRVAALNASGVFKHRKKTKV